MRGKRLRMKGKRLRMKGKRLRMKVLVGEDRLEDQDAIVLGCPIDFDIRRPYYAAMWRN